MLAAAQSHVDWAERTMREIIDGANAEADRTRVVTARTLADHSRRRRQQLQGVLARVSHTVRQRLDAAAAESSRTRAQAEAILEAAAADAKRTAADATSESERLLAQAQAQAQATVNRAERRLVEAEHGARLIRERTAAEVEKLHREAHADRRAARAELVQTLAEARDEADHLRAQAREAVEAARAEVHSLAARRDDINIQLGHLSNVIEALAVPERFNGARTVASADSPQDSEHPAYRPTPAATTPTSQPLPQSAVDHPADDLTLIDPLP
jgi:antitoxin component HigA of HigAB toxin-antitoxin module